MHRRVSLSHSPPQSITPLPPLRESISPTQRMTSVRGKWSSNSAAVSPAPPPPPPADAAADASAADATVGLASPPLLQRSLRRGLLSRRRSLSVRHSGRRASDAAMLYSARSESSTSSAGSAELHSHEIGSPPQQSGESPLSGRSSCSQSASDNESSDQSCSAQSGAEESDSSQSLLSPSFVTSAIPSPFRAAAATSPHSAVSTAVSNPTETAKPRLTVCIPSSSGAEGESPTIKTPVAVKTSTIACWAATGRKSPYEADAAVKRRQTVPTVSSRQARRATVRSLRASGDPLTLPLLPTAAAQTAIAVTHAQTHVASSSSCLTFQQHAQQQQQVPSVIHRSPRPPAPPPSRLPPVHKRAPVRFTFSADDVSRSQSRGDGLPSMPLPLLILAIEAQLDAFVLLRAEAAKADANMTAEANSTAEANAIDTACANPAAEPSIAVAPATIAASPSSPSRFLSLDLLHSYLSDLLRLLLLDRSPIELRTLFHVQASEEEAGLGAMHLPPPACISVPPATRAAQLKRRFELQTMAPRLWPLLYKLMLHLMTQCKTETAAAATATGTMQSSGSHNVQATAQGGRSVQVPLPQAVSDSVATVAAADSATCLHMASPPVASSAAAESAAASPSASASLTLASLNTAPVLRVLLQLAAELTSYGCFASSAIALNHPAARSTAAAANKQSQAKPCVKGGAQSVAVQSAAGSCSPPPAVSASDLAVLCRDADEEAVYLYAQSVSSAHQFLAFNVIENLIQTFRAGWQAATRAQPLRQGAVQAEGRMRPGRSDSHDQAADHSMHQNIDPSTSAEAIAQPESAECMWLGLIEQSLVTVQQLVLAAPPYAAACKRLAAAQLEAESAADSHVSSGEQRMHAAAAAAASSPPAPGPVDPSVCVSILSSSYLFSLLRAGLHVPLIELLRDHGAHVPIAASCVGVLHEAGQRALAHLTELRNAAADAAALRADAACSEIATPPQAASGAEERAQVMTQFLQQLLHHAAPTLLQLLSRHSRPLPSDPAAARMLYRLHLHAVGLLQLLCSHFPSALSLHSSLLPLSPLFTAAARSLALLGQTWPRYQFRNDGGWQQMQTHAYAAAATAAGSSDRERNIQPRSRYHSRAACHRASNSISSMPPGLTANWLQSWRLAEDDRSSMCLAACRLLNTLIHAAPAADCVHWLLSSNCSPPPLVSLLAGLKFAADRAHVRSQAQALSTLQLLYARLPHAARSSLVSLHSLLSAHHLGVLLVRILEEHRAARCTPLTLPIAIPSTPRPGGGFSLSLTPTVRWLDCSGSASRYSLDLCLRASELLAQFLSGCSRSESTPLPSLLLSCPILPDLLLQHLAPAAHTDWQLRLKRAAVRCLTQLFSSRASLSHLLRSSDLLPRVGSLLLSLYSNSDSALQPDSNLLAAGIGAEWPIVAAMLDAIHALLQTADIASALNSVGRTTVDRSPISSRASLPVGVSLHITSPAAQPAPHSSPQWSDVSADASFAAVRSAQRRCSDPELDRSGWLLLSAVATLDLPLASLIAAVQHDLRLYGNARRRSVEAVSSHSLLSESGSSSDKAVSEQSALLNRAVQLRCIVQQAATASTASTLHLVHESLSRFTLPSLSPCHSTVAACAHPQLQPQSQPQPQPQAQPPSARSLVLAVTACNQAT